MSYVAASFRLTGTAPLLIKNGQTADPLNEFAKASKKISSIQKKTDADHLELRKVDFLGALYMNAQGPCLPLTVLQGSFIKGAMKKKKGPVAKSATFISKSADLMYEGPRDAAGLYSDSFT
jgi:hypothetical protein